MNNKNQDFFPTVQHLSNFWNKCTEQYKWELVSSPSFSFPARVALKTDTIHTWVFEKHCKEKREAEEDGNPNDTGLYVDAIKTLRTNYADLNN